jgi:hypothetical protein
LEAYGKYFGSPLRGDEFRAFLSEYFVDLTEYNILESDYITSDLTGIEFGFTNNDAVYDDDDEVIFEEGNPIFSHYNLFPKSEIIVNKLPFEISFRDSREVVFIKAGLPIKTNKGYSDLLNKEFLVDSYKINDIIITFDYNGKDETINHISVRSNNLLEHLKM